MLQIFQVTENGLMLVGFAIVMLMLSIGFIKRHRRRRT